MALSCLYTDLDGTLLGKGGSLFRDADGGFTMLPARALEACNRAGAEVVIKSGRREAQVLEDSKLIGSGSYIYEAGCGIVIEGEKTHLVGGLTAPAGKTLADHINDEGVPQMLFDAFPGRLEYHRPWHSQRELSHLFRGKVEVERANELLAESGHDDWKLIDNGAIFLPMGDLEGPAHAYHLMPAESSKANAVVFHMKVRGYDPADCIGVGDSVEDLAVAEVVGRYFVPANGPERDAGLREAIGGRDNVTVTEGRNGEGVYEAVVSTLAER